MNLIASPSPGAAVAVSPGATFPLHSLDDCMSLFNEAYVVVRKLNEDLRDVCRRYFEQQQAVQFDRLQAARGARREAIQSTFSGEQARGWTGIVAGVFGAGAAAAGPVSSASAQGLGRAGDGIAGVYAAGQQRDAQGAQLLGDMYGMVAEQRTRQMNELADEAATASRRMAELQRGLVEAHRNLAAAVRNG